MQVLRLLTFGGLVLLVGGEPTTGTVTQRRRLALLALLAVARSRGLSRDKLLAYLWPQSDTARARHGLEQVLYAQKRALGADALFLGVKTLRLNREAITTDVWEFEDAVDAGDDRAAVRLYTGPFLDGFFLRGALEFERWVEDERDRLARRCAQALGALASGAAAAHDYSAAAEWWRRATELNPYDSETAIRLVEACVATGNRAAALRYGQRHTERLRSELGVEPDTRVVRLIEALRTGPGG
jgi:DNA-binding SARP family transcriptional activator